MKSDVSIVIPTWNGLDLLKRFLSSVIAAANHYIEHAGRQVEILIVDDGSTDDTISWLQKQGAEVAEQESFNNLHPVAQGHQSRHEESSSPLVAEAELRFLQNSGNVGFGETCNNGIKVARYPLIYLL